MPTASIPAAIAAIGDTIASGAAAIGIGSGAAAAGDAALMAGVVDAGAGIGGTIAGGALAAGAGAAAGSTLLSSLGSTALTTAAGVGLTKILNPTPKIPQAATQQPVMPTPNDGTVLNQQRQLAAQQSAQRLGRQSTILQSPGSGDYSAATF